jgi:putative membrane protein
MTLWFFETRAPFIMNLVALGMGLLVPLIAWSIYLVRQKKAYKQHKTLQLIISGILLTVVVLFEVCVRIYGWEEEAKPSPYYETILYPVLYGHLFFAISAALIWSISIFKALSWDKKKHLSKTLLPGASSGAHKKMGWTASFFMTMTSITGWFFYYLAFVA